jgi:hypothetical protein
MIQRHENMDSIHFLLNGKRKVTSTWKALSEDPHLRTRTLMIPFFHHSKVTMDGTDMFWQEYISALEGFRLWLTLILQTHTWVSSLSRCSQSSKHNKQTPNATNTSSSRNQRKILGQGPSFGSSTSNDAVNRNPPNGQPC